jgi:4-amino-4-deoxy-L-arabinose transferase-like glycosyltransferase
MRFVVADFIEKRKYLFLAIVLLLGAFLRLYKVSEVPPGLYVDEISNAYNGYEILTKGADEHGVKFPLWFQAFGEYKMPMFIYTVAGSIAIFGRTDFAVRFPAVVSGILTILVFYFFIENLASLGRKYLPFAPPIMALAATFFLAISTWHIHFSRGGFEATIALFFYLLSLFCVVLAYRKKSSLLLAVSFIPLALTCYSYNVYRFIALMTFIVVSGIFFLKQKQIRRGIILSAVLFIAVMLPVVMFTLSSAGAERFAETSAFSAYAGLSFTEKLIKFPIIFLSNYLSYFSLHFLFNIGDGIGRHQLASAGPVQYWEFPFLLIGLYLCIKNWRNPFYLTILTLGIVSPLTAAFAVPSPHTLRSLIFVIPFGMICSLGLMWLVKNFSKGKRMILLFAVMIFMLYEFTFYLHTYYQHYPIINSKDWGSGNEEMVIKTMQYLPKFKHIVIDENLGARTIPLYFGYYTQDKFKPLIVSPDWQKPNSWTEGTTLYVRAYYGLKTEPHIINTVYYPGNNKDIFAQFWKL